MDDLRTTARVAREGLARGLGLLQDPSVPPQLMDAAGPIARAMGALLQAERSDGRAASIRPNAETALAGAREALNLLQSLAGNHPVVEQAMSAVAGSLGSVHALTRAEDAPAAPQYQAPQQAYAPPPQYQPPPQQQAHYQQPPQQQYAPPAPAYQAPPAFQPPAPAYSNQPSYTPPVVPPYQPPPAPAYQPPPPPQAAPAAAPAMSGGVSGPDSMPHSLPPPRGTVEAELAAHSPSNFYKTLSGNDIVEHGGIFVATYAIPRIGSQVTLRIHLPGGYHFDCGGIVRWTRESPDNPDAPPGFGAQFQGISTEQRSLIQRYVRNREPLFYDDF